MKLTIEPTVHFFTLGDVMVRLWQGHDEGGRECVALLTCVGFAGQAAAIAEGLVEIPPPSPDEAQRWAFEVLTRQGNRQ